VFSKAETLFTYIVFSFSVVKSALAMVELLDALPRYSAFKKAARKEKERKISFQKVLLVDFVLQEFV